MSLPSGSSGKFNPGALAAVPAYDLVAVLIVYLLSIRLLPFVLFPQPEADDLAATAPAVPQTSDFMLFVAASCLILLAAIYIIIIWRRGLRLADLGIVLISKSWALQAAAFGITIYFINGLLTQILHYMREEPFHNPQVDVFVSGGLPLESLLPTLLVTGVLVPITEEIAFRGLFYGWLRTRVSFAMALAISSAVFALFHGILFLIPIFALIGLALALITEKSGSVLAAAITHGVFNSINIGALYIAFYYGLLPQ